jgi:hypothetical protein
MHPDLAGQLAREHHGQMLAEAGQRQLRHRHRHRHQAARNAGAAGTIIRRVATAIAGTGIAAGQSSTAGHHLAAGDCGATSRTPADRPQATAAMPGWQAD